MAKRLLDIVGASLGLVLVSPCLLVIAAFIKLDSHGPVLFKQKRIGRAFRPFVIYKFRTMSADAQARGPLITRCNDSRITRIGRILRRLKLDELPQLFNVIKGDMSLVGPRPELPKYVELFREDYGHILSLRPGLTDPASLEFIAESGMLANGSDPEHEYVAAILPQKIRLAREYIQDRSFGGDLTLLLRTFGKLVPVPAFLERAMRHPVILVVLAIDANLITLAYCGAFALRFDGQIPRTELAMLRATLPWVVGVQMALYFALHVNQILWRYVSLGDVAKIALAAANGMMVFALANGLYFRINDFPRSIYVLDVLLQISFLSGSRMLRRIAHDLQGADRGKRVLIFGAGDAGEMIVRDMKHNPYYSYSPVGFIDDDPQKVGRRIHGVRVLGTRADMPRIMANTSPDEIIVAMPRVQPATLRGVIKALEAYRVAVKTVPNVRDILNGQVSVSHIRNFALADLLGRAPAGLDAERVRTLFAGRRIMVTGAGGSIGAELCRQILSFKPQTLVMYERHENSLYLIENELRDKGADTSLIGLVGDVCDQDRTEAALSTYGIDSIFHAAAHKHVPLMELNPCEAIKNNVRGTRALLETAAKTRVERFILISTDKAVNPSNVMGASKRIAEMLVQDIARRTGLKFAAVRFGNVLGSNGSVVPRFLDQIRAGGPVTVTHPDVTRFFMLIPEAVQLVLHAAGIAEPGAIYVLEMGDQIKIVEMAHHLIRLAGYIPQRDIKIEFTGLRPGEKLYEELVGEDERAESSALGKVLVVRDGIAPDSEWLSSQIVALEASAVEGRESAVIATLRSLIPGFKTAWTDTLRPPVFATSAGAGAGEGARSANLAQETASK